MSATIINGNALHIPLADESVQMACTSPPYFNLRSYLSDGNPLKGHELGSESVHDCAGWATGLPCGECYVCHMVAVFREVRRVLKPDGVLFLNLGDSYAGSGGAGGDYAPGGLREGQPKFDGTAKRARQGLDCDPKRGHRAVGQPRPPGFSKSKRIDRGSGRWGGGNAPASGHLKPKDLVGIPWRIAFALQADGWWLRSDIIWHKPNPMPESVTDRPTKSHEYLFLLAKSADYFYDAEAIKEPAQVWTGQAATFERESGKATELVAPGQSHPSHRPNRTPKEWTFGKSKREQRVSATGGALSGGTGETVSHGTTRNRRSVWTIPTSPYKGAHFATFPPALVEPCILAGSRPGDIVLDPFAGTATAGVVAVKHRRRFVGVELNPEYIALARERLSGTQITMVFQEQP